MQKNVAYEKGNRWWLPVRNPRDNC